MPAKSSLARKAKPSPLHIRAWFDTVLNPLICGLEDESALLQRGDLTWRFRQQEFVSLVPVRSQIPAEALPNLDQFVAFHPSCSQPMEAHDRSLYQLLNACKLCHAKLTQSSSLRAAFDRVAKSLPPGKNTGDLFGALAPSEYLEVLAEYILNNIRHLPSFYATAQIWNPNGTEFFAVRDAPEVRVEWQTVESAREAFAQAIKRLTGVLTALRHDLSLSSGIPIVEAVSR